MDNKSALIKIQKQVNSKINLAKTVIKVLTTFNEIKISETEITVLAYFIVYGVNLNTKKLIVSSAICKNLNNVKTIMFRLKKEGLIYKDDLNGKVYVNKIFNLKDVQSAGIYLKIDNKV